MELKKLMKIGMSPSEAMVFNEILSSKKIDVSTLIKKVELHRATIYDALRKLVAKGFVSFIEQDNLKFYSPNRDAFDEFLNAKEQEYKYDLKIVKEIKDIISSRVSEEHEKQNVQIFLGVKAFKILFYKMYEYCRKTKQEYVYLGYGGHMLDTIGKKEYVKSQKLKKQMGIKCRVILSESSKSHPYTKYVYGKIKFIPDIIKSPVDFWVYGNNIMIALWKANPTITIIIESKDAATSLKNYFEMLWAFNSQKRNIERIGNEKEYTEKLLELLKEDSFKMIYPTTAVPISLFYPRDKEKMLRVRKFIVKRRKTKPVIELEKFQKVVESERNLFKKGKKFQFLICSPSTLDFHFRNLLKILNKKEIINLIDSIFSDLKRYNITAKIIEDSIPYDFVISNKTVLFLLRVGKFLEGLAIKDKKIVKNYRLFFDKLFEKAHPIEPYLNKILNKIISKSKNNLN